MLVIMIVSNCVSSYILQPQLSKLENEDFFTEHLLAYEPLESDIYANRQQLAEDNNKQSSKVVNMTMDLNLLFPNNHVNTKTFHLDVKQPLSHLTVSNLTFSPSSLLCLSQPDTRIDKQNWAPTSNHIWAFAGVLDTRRPPRRRRSGLLESSSVQPDNSLLISPSRSSSLLRLTVSSSHDGLPGS